MKNKSLITVIVLLIGPAFLIMSKMYAELISVLFHPRGDISGFLGFMMAVIITFSVIYYWFWDDLV